MHLLEPEFWTVCAQLDALQMDDIPATNIPSNISLPKLKSLALMSTRPYTDSELDFLRLCPNLRKLRLPFTYMEGAKYRNRFSHVVEENAWPKLCELEVGFLNLEETAIITLLQNPEWKAFSVTHSLFGSKAFKSLRDHFATLEVLNLQGGVHITGEMYQEILSSCPLLKEFQGDKLHASVIANGRPWVCTSLREFRCLIDCSGMKRSTTGTKVQEMTLDDEIQRCVFEMLSRLWGIEYIVIRVNDGKAPCLQLSIRKGLELLEGCKFVKEIDFDSTDQDLTQDDVRWMTSHWKDFETSQRSVAPLQRGQTGAGEDSL